MKKLFVLIVLLSVSAWAERKCTFQGKEFDIYRAPNRDTFSGVVKCKNEFSSETIEEEQTYKNGRLIEEKFDGKNRKDIHRYYPDSPNQWRHGEQIDYYPKTNKIRRKENYQKMHQVGMQESFYESGKIEERKFYIHENENRGSEEAASIGYLENGSVRYIRCAKEKKNTIDPKLCGFEGLSRFSTYLDDGAIGRTLTYKNGELLEEEIPGARFSARNNDFMIGLQKDLKPATVRITYNGKSKKYIYLSEKNKPLREFTFDDHGKVSGEDKEFFPNEKLARKTDFEKGEVTASECWWENGKPRGKYKKTKDGIEATMTWGNGTVQYSAQFIEKPDEYYSSYKTDKLLDIALQCARPDYSFSRQGNFTEFNEAGKKIYEGAFEKGEETGWHKSYDENGTLVEELLYDTSKKPAFVSQKKTYKDGKLVSDKKLNSDGSPRE